MSYCKRFFVITVFAKTGMDSCYLCVKHYVQFLNELQQGFTCEPAVCNIEIDLMRYGKLLVMRSLITGAHCRIRMSCFHFSVKVHEESVGLQFVAGANAP